MQGKRSRTVFPGVSLAAAAAAGRAESVDYGTVTLIRDEGFNGSKVMETLAQLTDVLGPRLTGSPAAKRANEWTRDQRAAWGLVNAHLESFGPFGRGWSLERVSVQAISPFTGPLIALPKAWTPGTESPVRGKTRFHDDDEMAHNTIAEIPGTDRQPEVVMLGAHLDSWHGGTGATDNAAGSAVAMEAVRILKALDVKPRRRIRIAGPGRSRACWARGPT